MAKPMQPAIAMAQPTILGNGKVSPWVKRNRATKMTTLLGFGVGIEAEVGDGVGVRVGMGEVYARE